MLGRHRSKAHPFLRRFSTREAEEEPQIDTVPRIKVRRYAAIQFENFWLEVQLQVMRRGIMPRCPQNEGMDACFIAKLSSELSLASTAFSSAVEGT